MPSRSIAQKIQVLEVRALYLQTTQSEVGVRALPHPTTRQTRRRLQSDVALTRFATTFFFLRSFRHGPIYVHVSQPASARMHVGWAWAMSRDAGEWSPPKPMSCDAGEWSPPKPMSCDAGNKWNPQKAMSRIETPVTGAVLVFTKPIGSWVGVTAFRSFIRQIRRRNGPLELDTIPRRCLPAYCSASQLLPGCKLARLRYCPFYY